MYKAKLIKYIFLAVIATLFLLPMDVSANYCPTDPDGWWCDYSDDMFKFGWDWRTDGAPDDPGVDTSFSRGIWRASPVDPDLDNDAFDDPTFATTASDDFETILYRIQDGGKENFRDYQVTATFSGDKEKLGIAFYYQDENNFYRLVFNNGSYGQYPSKDAHSVYLKRRVEGTDTLLAIAPWPGTHHQVKPYQTVTLRVRVVTGTSGQKFISAQYLNDTIGAYVDLFDNVKTDDDGSITYGWAGAYASDKRDASGNYRLHHIDVRHIDRITAIRRTPESQPGSVSDPYLLDYRDDNGDGSVTAYLEYENHSRFGAENSMERHWFLDDAETPFASSGSYDPVSVTIPVGKDIEPAGKHRVYLFESEDRTGPDGGKEIWVSSKSAFTIAVIPDMHARQSTYIPSMPHDGAVGIRDFQIRGIMEEIKKRSLEDTETGASEDNVKACIQVGDMAMRGTADELAAAKYYFSEYLPKTMPLIAAIGNHDYLGCPTSAKPMDDRGSGLPDHYIFDVVTAEKRIKSGYGVETPRELDNMFFLLDDDYLGDADSGKWLVMSLQPEPMTKDLFWAEKVLKTYPDYNVILVTHQFLKEYDDPDEGKAILSIDNEIMEWDLIWPPICPPIPFISWQTTGFSDANPPLTLWKFLRKYDQIKIILDGHTSTEGGLLAQKISRPCGGDMLAVMTDVSYDHSMQGAGGQFRLLEIDPVQSMVRGRLAYANTLYHVGAGYAGFDVPEQATNATHSDAYFIQEMDLSNSRSPDYLLFEDFNSGVSSVNRGLPASWVGVNDDGASPASYWRVDMSNANTFFSLDHQIVPIIKILYPETDIGGRMSRFGRAQEIKGTHSCGEEGFLKGTYLLYNDPAAIAGWKDYTFEVDLSAGDHDGIGVMFYYTDKDNYYRFSMFNELHCGQEHRYTLEKVAGGKRTLLAWSSMNRPFKMNIPYKVAVDLTDRGSIRVRVSEAATNSVIVDIAASDPTPPTHGTVALYSWGMDNTDILLPSYEAHAGAIFDNVLLTTGSNTYTDVDRNAPVPDVATLPEIRGQCSAEVTDIPTATDSCKGKIEGTTNDPLEYTEQGTYTITWIYDDGAGNMSFQYQTVIVQDTMPPTIESLTADPDTLWSPNHKMVPVSVDALATDNCDSDPVCTIAGVASSEAQRSNMKNDKSPDWEITGGLTVDLRAERFGRGDGRVYTTDVSCSDYVGNATTGQVTVSVPHDRNAGKKR